MKVCLITSAKDEDDHIEEFLEHYFNIVGIDHVFWIDNNTEPLKPVIINDDRVTVIDKRNVNFDSGKDKPLFIMRDLLNEVYQKYIVNSEYDWCCYFDPDELLELQNDVNIKDYLNEKNDKEMVLFPWVMHGNNNYIWENELPSDRMKINYGYKDNYEFTKIEYKPIFRVRPEYKLNVFFYDTSRIIDNCDSEKIFVDNKSKLHHYRVQCLETYIKHKINNGFYGHKNKDKWCNNLFFSTQFRKSNVRVHSSKIEEFKKLLLYYDMDKVITGKDRKYLLFAYHIKI